MMSGFYDMSKIYITLFLLLTLYILKFLNVEKIFIFHM